MGLWSERAVLPQQASLSFLVTRGALLGSLEPQELGRLWGGEEEHALARLSSEAAVPAQSRAEGRTLLWEEEGLSAQGRQAGGAPQPGRMRTGPALPQC